MISKVKPSWLRTGARVVKVGSWPRVRLADGTHGTVTHTEEWPQWFQVLWDNHEGYQKQGVSHYGWHATDGNVQPLPPPEST